MTEFWVGAIWASIFWIMVYAIAVVIWAIWDARARAAEMMNTEAANDRDAFVYNPKRELAKEPLREGPWNDALPRDASGRIQYER